MWVHEHFHQPIQPKHWLEGKEGRVASDCEHNNSSLHAEASLGIQITAQHAAAKESGHTFCVTFLSELKIRTSARFSRRCRNRQPHLAASDK